MSVCRRVINYACMRGMELIAHEAQEREILDGRVKGIAVKFYAKFGVAGTDE